MDEKYWENLYNDFKSFDSSIEAGEDVISLQEFKSYVEEDPMAFYKNHEDNITSTPGMLKNIMPILKQPKQEEVEVEDVNDFELDFDIDLGTGEDENATLNEGEAPPTEEPEVTYGATGVTGATGALSGVSSTGTTGVGGQQGISDLDLNLEDVQKDQGESKAMSKQEWDLYDSEEDLVKALNKDVRYMDFEFEEDTNFEDVVQIYDKKQKKYHYVPLNTSYNKKENPDKDYSSDFESFMKITQLGLGVDESAEEEVQLMGPTIDLVYDEDGYLIENKSKDVYGDKEGKSLSEIDVAVIDKDGNIKQEKTEKFKVGQGGRDKAYKDYYVEIPDYSSEDPEAVIKIKAKDEDIAKAITMANDQGGTIESNLSKLMVQNEELESSYRFDANLMAKQTAVDVKVDNTLNTILKSEQGRDYVNAIVDGNRIKLPNTYMHKWSGTSAGLESKKNLAKTINSFSPLIKDAFPKEQELLQAQELYLTLPKNIPTNPEERINWLNIDGNYSMLLKQKSNWLLDKIHNSDDPIMKQLKQKATDFENQEIINSQVKDAALKIEELYPNADKNEINAKANFAVNSDLTFDQINIFASDGYGVIGVDKPTQDLVNISNSFHRRKLDLDEKRLNTYWAEYKKNGGDDALATAVALQTHPVSTEDIKSQNQLASAATNFLDDPEIDIYSDIEGNYGNTIYSRGERKNDSYIKDKIKEYQYSDSDWLNGRILKNNAEIIQLARQLNNKSQIYTDENDASIASKVYDSFGNLFNNDDVFLKDRERIQEIAKTGVLPNKITTIPNSNDPLVKAWNDAVEDRAVLGISKVLNVDWTTSMRDGFWGNAGNWGSAMGFEELTYTENKHRLFNEIEDSGIELTDQNKYDMQLLIGNSEKIGAAVPEYTKMGAEMGATFLLTGGAGNVTNLMRWGASNFYRGMGAAGIKMAPKTAAALTNFTTGVGVEFVGLQGASVMEQQLFDKEGMSASHNFRMALTMGVGRYGVTKIGDKLTKSVYNVAKNQAEKGNYALTNLLTKIEKTPGLESVNKAINFSVKQPGSAAMMMQGENAIEGMIHGQSFDEIFHDMTNGNQLFETYASFALMQMMHPKQAFKNARETYRREVDRRAGDTPMWNSGYRQLGLNNVRGSEVHSNEVVDKAVADKIKQIKKDGGKNVADQIAYFNGLGNKLKQKASYHEFVQETAKAEVAQKETASQEKYGKEYKDLEPSEKNIIDNSYEDLAVFHNTAKLKATVSAVNKGVELNAADILNLTEAGYLNDGKDVIYELMVNGGMSEVGATYMYKQSKVIGEYAKANFSMDPKALRSENGKSFINNSKEIQTLTTEINRLQEVLKTYKQPGDKESSTEEEKSVSNEIELLESLVTQMENANTTLIKSQNLKEMAEIYQPTVDLAKKAGHQVFEGNTAEVNELKKEFVGVEFSEIESGLMGIDSRKKIINPKTGRVINNPNLNKPIQIFNTEMAKPGTAAHEVLGHASQELLVGNAAINKRKTEIMKKNPEMSEEIAGQKALNETFDYIDKVKERVKSKRGGEYEKVEAEMESRPGYIEYKESVEAGGPRDIATEKEFLAELVEMAEAGGFDTGIKPKTSKPSGEAPSSISPRDMKPAEYADFILEGGLKDKSKIEGAVKSDRNKLIRLQKKYGIDTKKMNTSEKDLSKNSKVIVEENKAINDRLLESEEYKQSVEEGREEVPQEFKDEFITNNMGRAKDLAAKASNNPNFFGEGVKYDEWVMGYYEELVKIANTYKPSNAKVLKDKSGKVIGRQDFGAYMNGIIAKRYGDVLGNITKGETKAPTVKLDKEVKDGESKVDVVDESANPQEALENKEAAANKKEKAETSGVDARRVITDPAKLEAYEKKVEDEFMKEITDKDGEINKEKLEELDYSTNEDLAKENTADLFGIDVKTLEGKNPRYSRTDKKGKVKVEDGKAKQSENYNLNKKLYEISETYVKLLNETNLFPKDIIEADIKKAQDKVKENPTEANKKALQKLRDIQKLQRKQVTGDQAKQGTSLKIDPSILKALYKSSGVRSMGKKSQGDIKSTRIDVKEFRERAGIQPPGVFESRSLEKLKAADKLKLRNEDTLKAALARNYGKLLNNKIKRNVLEKLGETKAAKELKAGSSEFSASPVKVKAREEIRKKIAPRSFVGEMQGMANWIKGFAKDMDIAIPKERGADGTVRDPIGQQRLSDFAAKVLSKYFGESILSGQTWSNTKLGKGMWFSTDFRNKVLKEFIKEQKGKSPLTTKEYKALKAVMGSPGLDPMKTNPFGGKQSVKWKDKVNTNYEGLDLFIDKSFEMLKENPEYLGEFLAMMKGSSSSNSHFWRNASQVIGKHKNWADKVMINPKKKGVGVGEHALVQNQAGEFMTKAILESIARGNTKAKNIAKKLLNENYFQILISHGLDGKLTQVGLQSSMLKGFWESWNKALETGNINEAWSVWSRYFNEKINKIKGTDGEFGFDPNKIDLLNRKTGEVESLADMLEIGKKEFGEDILNPEIIAKQQELIAKWATRQEGFTKPEQLRERLAIELDMLNAKRDASLKTYKEINGVENPIFVFMESSKIPNKLIVDKAKVFDKALENARKIDKEIKKARVFDFDDTVARTNSKVFAERAGERIELTAEEFAARGDELIAEGYKMDFSDFNRVVDGKKGPLFDLMKKMKEAAGDRDLFILTARAPESAPAIKQFLDAMGIKIPLENITGLGNSAGKAKADWLVKKAAEGYNDFYFADDAPQNVKAVRDAMEILDVKSQVQQARMNASNKMNDTFNKIIEESTGIESQKIFSDIKAEIRGEKAARQKFFIPPSAEDFTGLLYRTLGKGKKGEAGMEFYKESLIDPYTRAMENLSQDRVNLMSDFKKLKKELEVPAELRKKTKAGFKREDAVRAHIWQKTGKEIPGISKSDLAELNKIMESDPRLQAFADQILSITKGDGYSTPEKGWVAGTITTDLISTLNKTKRAKYLEPWKQNVDVIFSKENLNKLEAAYGKKYREALENSLTRMKAGTNRTSTGNKMSNRVLDYINNANGTIMFLNTRSAVLQTISAANFTNWTFNNPLKMGLAFANQPQYWKDFVKLMNSDYLVDRRNGLKLNISESEIANAAATGTNKAKAAMGYILEKGYLPTKFADSFAIASGGSMYYRNRVKDLMKNNGMTKAQAEKRAMEDFREISEKSQQSSDPSKISQQQSSDLGRVVLSFANTPMQYARIQKRAVQDIVNGRGSMKENVGKIIYYGFLQNMLFNTLQQGLFALGFGDGEIGETEEKKIVNTVNGMVDSQLRGLGMAGVTLQVLKNLGINIYDRSKKDRPEYSDAWIKLLEFSPSIKSKLSKVKGAAYPFDTKKRRAEVFEKGFSLDNPAYESLAKVVSATTNLPLDRLYTKFQNIQGALDEDTEAWKAVAMLMGWPEWQLKTTEDVNQELSDDPSSYGAWEQKSILKQYKLSDEEIKKLKNEELRISKIKELQDKNKNQYFPKDEDKEKFYKPTKKEKEVIEKKPMTSPERLKSLKKDEQVRHLLNYGLSKKQIRELRFEAKRVEKLMEFAKNPEKVDSLMYDLNL